MYAIPHEALCGRLAVLRASRRRIGWFDFSPSSWDMLTTQARAGRIQLRLAGRREPLRSVHDGRAIPWNAYHH